MIFKVPMDVLQFLIAVISLYLVALICSAVSEKSRKFALPLMGLGWLANLAVIADLWIIYDAPPLGTIFHVLLGSALIFFPVCVMFRLYQNRMAEIPLMIASIIPIVGCCFMDPKFDWKPVPVLQSSWFIPHVLAYCIAYGLALAAFLVLLYAVFRLVMRWNIDQAFQTQRVLILLAFPFFIFGLCSGMLWGDIAWGTYWGWDQKEIWGLVTLLFYTLTLHLALIPNQRKNALIAHFCAFIAIIVTCFAVSFTVLGQSSLHSYASSPEIQNAVQK